MPFHSTPVKCSLLFYWFVCSSSSTYDGRTIRYPDPLIKANDTIKIDLETNKIMDFIKFDVGNVVMVTGGRNTGRVGVIKNREKHKGSFETIHVVLGAFCYV